MQGNTTKMAINMLIYKILYITLKCKMCVNENKICANKYVKSVNVKVM